MADKYLLEVLQLCYRKHCMADDYSQDIGWNELSCIIEDALFSWMGEEAFEAWKDSLKKKEAPWYGDLLRSDRW